MKKISLRQRIEFAWRLLRGNPVMFGMGLRVDPGRELTIGPITDWPGPVKHTVIVANSFDAPGGVYIFHERVPLQEVQHGR